jgi:hypothetical protein
MKTEEQEVKPQAASQPADGSQTELLADLPIAPDQQPKIKGGAKGWRSTGPLIFGPIPLPIPRNDND